VKVELRLERESVSPGEDLVGQVVALEGGPARKLTLTVTFFERSPAFLVPAFTSSAVVHEGELPTGASVDFTYRIPDWATPGVKGEHGELYWELEAAVDERGLDTTARRRFGVEPAPAS
jgi:hypothetical protein